MNGVKYNYIQFDNGAIPIDIQDNDNLIDARRYELSAVIRKINSDKKCTHQHSIRGVCQKCGYDENK